MGTKPGRRRLVMERLECRNLLAFDPTGLEQELMQLLNRMRTDPQGELGQLVDQLQPIHSPFSEINGNLQFFQVNGNVLAQQWQSLMPAPPLAWNASLWNAAFGHSQEMIRQKEQSHQLPGEPAVAQRIQNAGYSPRKWGESINAGCSTIVECHASFAIDWGFGPNGIQDPPLHRLVMMDPDYREVGLAAIEHTKSDPQDVGPLVITKDFASPLVTGDAYVVGAVFVDRDESNWYDSGEGLGGVTITLSGPAGTFQAISMSAGGYQVQVPPGTYTTTASGGGLRKPLTVTNVSVADRNVWVNFRQDPAPSGTQPLAIDDKSATDKDTSMVLDILANDSDAEGDLDPRSVQITLPPLHGKLTIDPQTGAATYSPHAGYLGLDRFRYIVCDLAGHASREVNAQLAVVDYAGSPWQNPQIKTDVDGNNQTTTQDALIVINRLISAAPSQLNRQPTGADSPPPYYDTSGDNTASLNDVLRIINEILRGLGEGEQPLSISSSQDDEHSVGPFATWTVPVLAAASRCRDEETGAVAALQRAAPPLVAEDGGAVKNESAQDRAPLQPDRGGRCAPSAATISDHDVFDEAWTDLDALTDRPWIELEPWYRKP